MAPIALLTDFGLRDPFVGIVKGVILGISPSSVFIDLSHDIKPGDIKSASFAMDMSFPYLPEGTIVLAVVDPGVGTQRRAVAVRIDGRVVVCPDNGLLSWVLSRQTVAESVELNRREYQLPDISSTFHARDIFAPVAAHLSLGVPLRDVGEGCSDLVAFDTPRATRSSGALRGEVVYIDRFGNLITNISHAEFNDWSDEFGGGRTAVSIGSAEVSGIHETYASVPRGHSAAVFGSSGLIEISVNGGSAEHQFGGAIGTGVQIYHFVR